MNADERKRENRLRMLEDHIGRSLAHSERSGELRMAKSFGKPLDLGDGYEETPTELRMGYKILKDAGVLPPEVELMREIESLNRELLQAADGPDTLARRQTLIEMRLKLSMCMERLRTAG